MKSYPTYYKEQLFRSRLEAKWAVFFDLLNWPYTYEPYDLKGYIPDFILQFHEPLLVEVKPEVLFKNLKQHTDKILKSGWEKEILIVGADLFKSSWNDCSTIGLLGQTWEMYGDINLKNENPDFEEGILFHCDMCKKPSIFHSIQSYHCRVNGCHRGDKHMKPFDSALSLWGLAHEKIQWYPKKGDQE